jgi:dTDP-glucose 4,6-dehydratase
VLTLSDKHSKYCVLGGEGFIGSNFIMNFLTNIKDTQVINFDRLTYRGRHENLKDFDSSRHIFIQGDISNRQALQTMLHHFAANPP